MPWLEQFQKEAVKKYVEEPWPAKGEQPYCRVLGQLAWAALCRADLSFPTSFLSRFQAKPNNGIFLHGKFLLNFAYFICLQQM